MYENESRKNRNRRRKKNPKIRFLVVRTATSAASLSFVILLLVFFLRSFVVAQIFFFCICFRKNDLFISFARLIDNTTARRFTFLFFAHAHTLFQYSHNCKWIFAARQFFFSLQIRSRWNVYSQCIERQQIEILSLSRLQVNFLRFVFLFLICFRCDPSLVGATHRKCYLK